MSARPADPAADLPTGGTPGPDAATRRPADVRSVRVARQGIYDARRQLVSYELLFSAPDGAAAADVLGDRATSQVIAATFGTFGLANIADGKPVFVSFTRAFLTGVLPLPVEPADVVLQVADRVAVDHELLLGLDRLRQAGYRVAVEDNGGSVARSPLVELADYVRIEVAALPPLVVPGLVQACRGAGATLVATGVEDAQTFARCVELGFPLFQGRHLHKPAVLERRTLSPSQLVCLRLLDELAEPELGVHRVEQLVGSDPGLTLRLLRTANSASAGAAAEVDSLRQALVLLGPRTLRSWVVLTLVEGAATGDPSDDLWSVLARAHACQRLAPADADLAFTVGLLSGAADLLGADTASIADGAGVGRQARSALVDGGGGAGHALSAVLAHEHDDVDAVTAAGHDPAEVSRAYLEALSESLQLVHDLLGR